MVVLIYPIIALIRKIQSILVPPNDLVQVTEILRKRNVGGITFYEINGADRMQRNALTEIVESGYCMYLD